MFHYAPKSVDEWSALLLCPIGADVGDPLRRRAFDLHQTRELSYRRQLKDFEVEHGWPVFPLFVSNVHIIDPFELRLDTVFVIHIRTVKVGRRSQQA